MGTIKQKILFFIVFLYSFTLFAQIESTQKVIASDRAGQVNFGYSVDVFDRVAIVGCPDDGTQTPGGHPHYDNGAAYVYERQQSSLQWQQRAKLLATDPFKTDRFGFSVATDGTTIAVASPLIDSDTSGSNVQTNAGAVYIFEKINGTWIQIQKLVASDRVFGDLFGQSISFRQGLLVVGAPRHATDADGLDLLDDAGAVFVFEKNNNGRWGQTAKLLSPHRQAQAELGRTVSTDGETILAGSKEYNYLLPDSTVIEQAGQLVFYKKNMAGAWEATTSYSPDYQAHKAHVGLHVDIHGAWAASILRSDSAYTVSGDYAGQSTVGIFKKLPDGTWAFHQKLPVPNFDNWIGSYASSFDLANNMLAIASDFASVSDSLGDYEFGGTAHLFRLDTVLDEWYFDRRLDDFPKKMHDFYGSSIATDGTHVLVGCTDEDEDENEQNTYPNSGAAYFYGECVPTYRSQQISACKSFEYGDSTYTQDAFIHDTIGCNKILDLQVFILESVPIEIQNNSLQVNTTGAVQWLDCNNGMMPIAGATGNSFAPTVSSMYAAEQTYFGGCVDTSDCVAFMLVSDSYLADNQSTMVLFPNPFDAVLTLESTLKNTTFQLHDAQGVLKKEGKLEGRKVEIDTADLPSGIYFLKVKNTDSNWFETKVLVKSGF